MSKNNITQLKQRLLTKAKEKKSIHYLTSCLLIAHNKFPKEKENPTSQSSLPCSVKPPTISSATDHSFSQLLKSYTCITVKQKLNATEKCLDLNFFKLLLTVHHRRLGSSFQLLTQVSCLSKFIIDIKKKHGPQRSHKKQTRKCM